MNKTLLTIVLVFAGVVVNQSAAQTQAQAAAPQQPGAQQPGQPGQPAPGQQSAPAQQKKEIKDPAEYNAYVGAVQQSDAAAKISGLEAFLQQYPSSIMKEDALELLMVAYQQTGNQAKMADAAQRLLQVNPNNVRALALLAYSNKAGQKWADAEKYAIQGLQALPRMQKGEMVSDADFEKQKTQLAALMNNVAGFSALQVKDYASAQKYLRAAVEADPNNLENVYPLALAYLTATPADDVNGLFFIARAASLAKDPAGKDQITKFGVSRYRKYHGSEQGWNEMLAMAATTPLPPPNFTISQYTPPTPKQQAHDLVTSKAPKDMSFAEWELILSAGDAQDAEKVWNAIKGVSLQMEGQVIKASSTKLEIAGSQDDIEQRRADVELTMTGPIPARLMPKDGSTLDFEGTPVSYTPSPFMMVMEKGALLTKAAPATKKRTPVHRRKPGSR